MYSSVWNKMRSSVYLQLCQYSTRVRKKENVGIGRRLKVLPKGSPGVQNISEEDIENFESDFMNISEFSDVHNREMTKIKKRIDYSKTERQYFSKMKTPNMLTWSEKEQIRLLHQSEPEMWTPSKLAESFPATEQIIKKIILNKWLPKDEERIIRHDQSVAANWKAFKHGKLNIPDKELKNHLKQFTSRESLPLLNENMGKKESNKEVKMLPLNGEFSKIITEYKARCNQDVVNKDAASSSVPTDPPSEILQLGYADSDHKFHKTNYYNKRKHLFTLDELRENVKSQLPVEEMRTESDKAFLKGSALPSEKIVPLSKFGSEETVKEKIVETQVIGYGNTEKYRQTEVTKIVQTNENDRYEMRIEIPKEKWKLGGTYRVKDCYYDDNGEFLYRVPGMK